MSDPVASLTAALAGRYEIERRLGEGGMATVYLARDLRHGRDVAIKVLKPELAAAVGSERFLAEVRTTARLQHPHLLPLFDSGEADGCLFYVMPFVSGETLGQRLERERQLPVTDAVHIATDVAEALDYAHRHGVIHRDIKPANILLHDGKAVVADFGIALAVSAGARRLTESGLSVGTPHYMSPEQATGDSAVGPATDVWALACVLYEMLVGEPPYNASTPHAILGKILQGEPASAAQVRHTVPLNVDGAIRKALEKIPADRFTTAGTFADALRNPDFRYGSEALSARGGSQRSTRKMVALAGLGVLLGVAATGAWFNARRRSAPAGVMRFVLPTGGAAALDTRDLWQDIAISPDGKLIAYVGQAAGASTSQIYVWPIGQLSGQPLSGSEGGGSPFFSPDGRSIGFVAGGDFRTLKRVPTAGGHAETIATLPASVPYIVGAAWGTDGRIIVGTGQGTGLYRVSVDGGTVEQLTKGQHHWPAIIENRDAVLLMDHTRGQHLAVLDLRTRKVKALGLEGTSPRYISTGHLVYADPHGSLWAVPFDAASLTSRGSPVRLSEDIQVKTATEGAANFAVSATGQLVFASGRTATNLVSVARDGTRSVLLRLNTWSAFPRFSPDGLRIAYDLGSEDGSGHVDIWTLDIARGARTRVTLAGDNRYFSGWTPDGKYLTHTRLTPGLPLLLTSADGSGATDTLLHSDGGYPTSWSPDGRTLAYDVDRQGSSDIALLHVRGNRSVTESFLQTAFREGGAIFSRTGRWIAYVSDKSGQNEIYARPYPGPGAEVTISVDGGTEPRWSPAGNEIFYRRGGGLFVATAEERGSELVVGTPVRVFPDPYRREDAVRANYDISPKGDRIVFVEDSDASTASGDRIYLVLNWFTELQAIIPR